MYAPLLSVAVVTVLYAVGALALRFVLGDPVDARNVFVRALGPTVLLNLILTFLFYASCGACCRPRSGRRRRCGSLANRGTGRFLPPDPRVDEPYRLTPKLALRLAILGAVALGDLRDPLPATVGAAGALRRPVPARRAEQPGCAPCASTRRAA